MKKIYLSSLCLLLAAGAFAQPKYEPCGFSKVLDYYRQADPTFDARFEESFKQSARNSSKTTAGVYRIPVVFHVVYNDTKSNIHDSVVMNQLQILNEAFRNTHSDTGNTRAIFKPLAGDAEIEFYLATKDPDGVATNGIIHTQTTAPYFMDYTAPDPFAELEKLKKKNSGGVDPWPTDKYLNIWITNLNDKTLKMPILAGYATPPTNPYPPNWQGYPLPPLGDGVVLHYGVIGNNNPQANPAFGTAGRNAVHEVGHYLGLRHIWGDAQVAADTCGPKADDGIGDTPPQAEASDINAQSCNAYANQNTCGAANSGDMMDMWENYMDYSNDKCQTMFTKGQVAHMRSIMENQRVFLKSAVNIAENKLVQPSFSVYPQPASNTIRVNYGGTIQHLIITNMVGAKVFEVKGDAANAKQYSIGNLPSGNYIISVQSADQMMTKKLVISH